MTMKRYIVLALFALPALLDRCGVMASQPQPQPRMMQPKIVVRIVATAPAPMLPTASATRIANLVPTIPIATAQPIEPTDMPAPIAPPTQMAGPNHPIADEARSVEDVHDQLLNLHNQARAEAGLSAYRMSLPLQLAAQQQANYLAAKPAPELMQLGLGGHLGPDGGNAASRAAHFGYVGRRVCENWAYFNNAQDAFDFWLTDVWHRPQVLSTELAEVGFGVSKHAEFGIVFVAVYGQQ